MIILLRLFLLSIYSCSVLSGWLGRSALQSSTDANSWNTQNNFSSTTGATSSTSTSPYNDDTGHYLTINDCSSSITSQQKNIPRDMNAITIKSPVRGRISGSAYSNAVSSTMREVENSRPKKGLALWVNNNLPKIDFRMDPVINFKLKQKINQFGACITLGMDYMSDMKQWRTYCAVEDKIFRGRFSLRGSELGWTKSWLWNLGIGEESSAKFKLRLGLNLNTFKVYARLRFRTEPMNPFDIGEGLSCAGKLPLPGILPILRVVPLRVEYRLRINTPLPDFKWKSYPSTDSIMLSTGIDKVDLSLDELNFCLEWDEVRTHLFTQSLAHLLTYLLKESPVWGIGVQSARRMMPSKAVVPSTLTKNNGLIFKSNNNNSNSKKQIQHPNTNGSSNNVKPPKLIITNPSTNSTPQEPNSNKIPKDAFRRFKPYDYFPQTVNNVISHNLVV